MAGRNKLHAVGFCRSTSDLSDNIVNDMPVSLSIYMDVFGDHANFAKQKVSVDCCRKLQLDLDK